MYHTTGLTRDRILELCELIHNATLGQGRNWPPVLGLVDSVVVALTYLRRNRVQVELAETYGVSQSTISRAITAVTPLLGLVLQPCVPTADQLGSPTQYVVGGALRSCWCLAFHPQVD